MGSSALCAVGSLSLLEATISTAKRASADSLRIYRSSFRHPRESLVRIKMRNARLGERPDLAADRAYGEYGCPP